MSLSSARLTPRRLKSSRKTRSKNKKRRKVANLRNSRRVRKAKSQAKLNNLNRNSISMNKKKKKRVKEILCSMMRLKVETKMNKAINKLKLDSKKKEVRFSLYLARYEELYKRPNATERLL